MGCGCLIGPDVLMGSEVAKKVIVELIGDEIVGKKIEGFRGLLRWYSRLKRIVILTKRSGGHRLLTV